jgi:uncharacterized metal-binding protein
MPSGKTHDRITFLLILPTFLAAYALTYQLEVSVLATLAMLFGGLMFGPDLDINSRQYHRWGPLRLLWWPYQKAFSHRSIFTHGIVVGTIVRIGYFCLVVTLVAFIGIYLLQFWQGKDPNAEILLSNITSPAIKIIQAIPLNYLVAIFAGIWLGAASHTLADVVTTTFKQIIKSL